MRYQILCRLKNFQRQLSPGYNLLHASTYSTEPKPDSKPNPPTWRRSWEDREGGWNGFFHAFGSDYNNIGMISLFQTKIDLSPSAVKRWWNKFQHDAAVLDMRFIPERHNLLGSDLAAAHFLVHRYAKIKFEGSPLWIERVGDEYPLPTAFEPNYHIEAIDIGKMKLFYEGYQNMTNLCKLKWLSLKGSEETDDWCIDRISCEYRDTLKYLDISDCKNVTYRGIGALYRMTELETLKVENIAGGEEFQLTCLMLEDLLPNLKIEGVKYIDIKQESA